MSERIHTPIVITSERSSTPVHGWKETPVITHERSVAEPLLGDSPTHGTELSTKNSIQLGGSEVRTDFGNEQSAAATDPLPLTTARIVGLEKK